MADTVSRTSKFVGSREQTVASQSNAPCKLLSFPLPHDCSNRCHHEDSNDSPPRVHQCRVRRMYCCCSNHCRYLAGAIRNPTRCPISPAKPNDQLLPPGLIQCPTLSQFRAIRPLSLLLIAGLTASTLNGINKKPVAFLTKNEAKRL